MTGARTRWWVAVGAGALMAGCSASPASAPVRSAATVAATPEASSTYAHRRQATIAIENGDGMVATAGALFVKTDDGRVVRVDPATNRVTGQVEVDTASSPDDYCQGIGADATSVWACAAGDDGTGLARVDPKTLRITRRVPVGKVFDQLTLPGTTQGIWVLGGDGSSLNVVDPASGTSTPYALAVHCLQVAAQQNRVVATAATNDAVLFIDAGTGKVAARATVHSPRLAAIAGTDVWVDSTDGLTRLRSDGTVRTVYTGLTAGPDGDLIASDGVVLLRSGDGTISRIDATTGHLVERITPDAALTGGSMIVAYGSFWLTSNDNGTLTRLRATA